MKRSVLKAGLSLILCGPILAQQPAPAPTTTPQTSQPAVPQASPAPEPRAAQSAPPARRKRSAAKKKTSQSAAEAEIAVPAAAPVAPAPPAPAAPKLPPTLMKQPPVPPTVTMRDGLLTIDAPNSTLSEVLKGVRQATGAVLEGVSPTDRVAVRLGPGHPREVVAALLQGTPYDYLILGSERDAQAVTRILLTQSSSSSEPNMPRQPQMIQAPIPEPPPEPAFVEPERPPEYFQPDQGVPPETVPEGDQAQPPTPPQPVSPERPMTAPPLPTPQP